MNDVLFVLLSYYSDISGAIECIKFPSGTYSQATYSKQEFLSPFIEGDI